MMQEAIAIKISDEIIEKIKSYKGEAVVLVRNENGVRVCFVNMGPGAALDMIQIAGHQALEMLTQPKEKTNVHPLSSV